MCYVICVIMLTSDVVECVMENDNKVSTIRSTNIVIYEIGGG